MTNHKIRLKSSNGAWPAWTKQAESLKPKNLHFMWVTCGSFRVVLYGSPFGNCSVVVVVVALLFYVHCKHLRSCRDGQLT